MKEGYTGTTADTPKSIMFGAGTIHKGLKYVGGKWNFAESCIGATQKGSKLNIEPDRHTIDIDGALVAVKGLNIKTGEKASMEINLVEIKKDMIKSALIGKEGTSQDNTYDLIESKPRIEANDYFENIAFVGKNLEGKNIIVILDNALCTSGFELEGKNKEEGVLKLKFECHADLTSSLDTLPYHIYYPKTTA